MKIEASLCKFYAVNGSCTYSKGLRGETIPSLAGPVERAREPQLGCRVILQRTLDEFDRQSRRGITPGPEPRLDPLNRAFFAEDIEIAHYQERNCDQYSPTS